jgi:chloramphenicol-sensitive protein RarD
VTDRRGLLAAIGAYVLWGVFPLYWHALRDVPSLQIVAHRMAWCAVFVAGWLLLREGVGWLRGLRGRTLALLALTSVLISGNWGVYIWAVTHGRVVDASLGYFINPLASVFLGVFVLRERLRAAQWTAVALAAAGVLWLAWRVGEPPWIALVLACSFAVYGLVRKVAHIEAVHGLAIESLLLMGPAVGYLLWAEFSGTGAFGHGGALRDTLLVLAGVATALPLAGFAYGARRIPYSLVGILQYISPTLQLLLGVLVFGEGFDRAQAIGFGAIWAALAIYAVDGWRTSRRRPDAGEAEHIETAVPPGDGATPPKGA